MITISTNLLSIGKKQADTNVVVAVSSPSTGCIKKLMEAQQSIRMHHWLTSSHAEHKALGEAYEGLDDLIDTFVETFIGAKGKGVLSGISGLSLHTEGNCMEVINTLEAVLRNDIPNEVGDNETALLNIRDEILGLVQKTKYLLTQTK